MTSDSITNPHSIAVTHERNDDGEIIDSTLTFTCSAPSTDPCHFWPDCGCESWNTEHDRHHPRAQQDRCWLADWFDVGFEATPYAPEDGESRELLSQVPAGSGPIEFQYDEGIFWRWTR